MTVKDWKQMLANYPDEMPVCIHTFRGVPEEDAWAPPADVEVKSVSTSERLSPDEKRKFKILDVLVD